MDSPVVLINPFTVSSADAGDYRERFGRVMSGLKDQPGFLGGALHEALNPDAADFAFINVNRWASRSQFEAAIGAVEPQRVFGEVGERVKAHGALYRAEAAHTYAAPGVRLVKRYFAAAHRNEAALVELLAPNAAIVVPDALPYGGSRGGAEGFRTAQAGFAAAWSELEIRDLQLVGDDDLVAAVCRMHATARATGRKVETGVAETFRIAEGRIVEVRPHYDDLPALLRALGLLSPN